MQREVRQGAEPLQAARRDEMPPEQAEPRDVRQERAARQDEQPQALQRDGQPQEPVEPRDGRQVVRRDVRRQLPGRRPVARRAQAARRRVREQRPGVRLRAELRDVPLRAEGECS